MDVYADSSHKVMIGQLCNMFLLFLSFRRRCLLKLLESAPMSETLHSVDENEQGGSLQQYSTIDTPISSPTKANPNNNSTNPTNRTSSGGHPQDMMNTTSTTVATTAQATTTAGFHLPHVAGAGASGSSSLSRNSIKNILDQVELNIATLSGIHVVNHENDAEDSAFSPLKPKPTTPTAIVLPEDRTPLQEYETALCEQLGIALPHCPLHGTHTHTEYCNSLESTLVQVETLLYHSRRHFEFEESLMKTEPPPPKPLAQSQALREMRQSLYNELWQGIPLEDLPDAPVRRSGDVHSSHVSSSNLLKPGAPPIHVVEEVNELMHKQRIDQCCHYLEVLNEKATRRKKMIRSLMNLWQAAKALITDRGRIPKFASEEEIELKRLQAMPPDEIMTQTRSIQQMLVKDMQEPTGTKLDQVRVIIF